MEDYHSHISKDLKFTSGIRLRMKEEVVDDEDDFKFQRDPLEMEGEMADREDTADIMSCSNNLKDHGERDPLNIKEESKDEEGEMKIEFDPKKECLKEELANQDFIEDSKDEIFVEFEAVKNSVKEEINPSDLKQEDENVLTLISRKRKSPSCGQQGKNLKKRKHEGIRYPCDMCSNYIISLEEAQEK